MSRHDRRLAAWFPGGGLARHAVGGLTRHAVGGLARCGTVLAAAGGATALVGGAEPLTATRLFPAGGAAGTTVTVRAAGTFPRWPVRVWTDRPGTAWRPLEEAGSFEVTIPPEDAPGIHRVRFHDDAGATAIRRFFVGTDADLLEVEPNDRPAAAQPVPTLPVTLHGILEKAGDVDCFTVPLEAGQTFVAALDAHTGLGSPVDAVLELVDDRGGYLARNLDARGLDPRIVFTAARSGPVTVRVYGFPATPNQTIGLAGGADHVYRLLLTVGPVAAAVVPAAVAATGTTRVAPVGWNLPAGPREPAGGNPHERAVTPPPNADRTWITFEGVSGVVDVPVRDATVAAVAAVDGGDPPAAVPPPVVFGGWFDLPGRGAAARISATKDAAVLVSVEAHAHGSEADPTLEIVSADGAVVLTKTDRDASFSWKPPSDGEYAFVLHERRGTAGPGHFFRLVVVPDRPEVRATTETDALVGAVAGTVEMTIAVERLRGWNEPVEFFLPDPPAGITAAAVTSAVDGDTAKKVTLTIAATAPWSGPLTVAARRPRAAEDAPQESAIIATVACGPERLPVLWLTVPPAAAAASPEAESAAATAP